MKTKIGYGGTRKLLLDDLRNERAEFPRAMTKTLDGYLEGAEKRPLFGFHKLARVTEHYLHKARYGKTTNRRFVGDAERVFFDVRQDISNLIHNHWKAGSRPDSATTERLRKQLSEHVAAVGVLAKKFGTVRRCVCPCCRGTGRIFDEKRTDMAVKAILDEAVRDGRLGYSRDCGYYGVQ